MTHAQKILQTAANLNHVDDMLFNAYRIHSDEKFDAVVVAPSWTPMRAGFAAENVINCKEYNETLKGNSGTSQRQPMMKKNNQSYVVDWNGLHIAWIKTGTCAGNVLDSLFLLANLETNCLIFLGAAGGISKDAHIGDIAVPTLCMDYLGATRYLDNELNCRGFGSNVIPANLDFIKAIIKKGRCRGIFITDAKVFCTDTIFGEYIHYDYIQNSGADVIEMETAAFFRVAEMMEKRAIAILTISDNAANGESLSAPLQESFERYNHAIRQSIPKLIQMVCDECN